MKNMGVDVTKTTPIACNKCGNATFVPAMFLRHVSAIISPTGKEELAPVPTFVCNACGHVPDKLVPSFMKEELKGEGEPTKEATSPIVASKFPHLTLEK